MWSPVLQFGGVISSGFKRVGMARWAQVTPGFFTVILKA